MRVKLDLRHDHVARRLHQGRARRLSLRRTDMARTHRSFRHSAMTEPDARVMDYSYRTILCDTVARSVTQLVC